MTEFVGGPSLALASMSGKARAAEDKSMSEYREFVQKIADISDGAETILNRTADHAAVIVSIIFSKAQQIVEVVSGRLDDAVWGGELVIVEAIGFLRRNPEAKIRIVLESNISLASNRFMSALIAANLINRVKLFVLRQGALEADTPHFLVADGMHFRFQGERATFEAVVQFGNLDRGQKLSSVFANLRANSDEITLPAAEPTSLPPETSAAP